MTQKRKKPVIPQPSQAQVNRAYRLIRNAVEAGDIRAAKMLLDLTRGDAHDCL
ncbi:hypothetical protein [Nitrincola schmidtii]|uniref:hypothetical protein n=1 Tax=Nitrincola schmidtii TaxID=1730894 RepID=UPI0014563FF2|nr:hypothetical protein [Nitrincola schmidtii]